MLYGTDLLPGDLQKRIFQTGRQGVEADDTQPFLFGKVYDVRQSFIPKFDHSTDFREGSQFGLKVSLG